ncbi:MAG TPA: rod shape-determining protein MreC [Candidatus Paceibacterota bacterium]
MSWYRQNKDASRGRRRMLIATGVVLAFVIADQWSGGIVRDGARVGSSFISGYVSSAALAVLHTGFFSSRRALSVENAELQTVIKILEERIAGYQALEEENVSLRSLLSVSKKNAGITAPIVSSVRASPYGTFLVGAGESSGILMGHIVLSSGGFVLGVVSDGGLTTSLVTSVFAPEETVRAVVSGVSILLEGRGGDNARAEVPRDARIAPGDIVVAPEYDGRPIGVVGEVVFHSGDASKTIYVRLPVNLASLGFVYIVPRP